MSKHHNTKACKENGGEAPPLAVCKGANIRLLDARDMLGGPHSLSECSCDERNPFSPWSIDPWSFMLIVSSQRAASGEESQFVSGLVDKCL
jgi:hypothetical protein